MIVTALKGGVYGVVVKPLHLIPQFLYTLRGYNFKSISLRISIKIIEKKCVPIIPLR